MGPNRALLRQCAAGYRRKSFDAAYSEFEQQRDQAFKDAGLQGALTPEFLATILGAEHFSMPADISKMARAKFCSRLAINFSLLGVSCLISPS